MKTLDIYVDTSVIGGCFEPEFELVSNSLIEMFIQGEARIVASDLLMLELSKAREEVRQVLQSIPDDNIRRVSITGETELLRDKYLEAGVVGGASSRDAHHIALATVYEANLIVSWNFKHIVHFEKIRGFNAVNIREGYKSVDIYSPLEIVS